LLSSKDQTVNLSVPARAAKLIESQRGLIDACDVPPFVAR
jgi:hypothetical protein